jgi:hypothetical protein
LHEHATLQQPPAGDRKFGKPGCEGKIAGMHNRPRKPDWKLLVLAGAAGWLGFGCAAARPDPAAAEWRKKLQAAMQAPVADRTQRDQNSRVLTDAVAHDALTGLNLSDVQAMFGQGQPCSEQSLCAEQGFSGDDLYYAIGQLENDKLKQLPVLIVGFDTHGLVKRVYTLSTE